MDELKILLEMVAHLPQTALWVIAFLFAYKVVVVGSIYGVIRLGIVKTHSWLTVRKTVVDKVVIDGQLDGLTITGNVPQLIAQIQRLRGKGVSIQSNYIHPQSVQWLAEAIDAKAEQDKADGKVWGDKEDKQQAAYRDMLMGLQNNAYTNQCNAASSQSSLGGAVRGIFG